jgi:hypothetical protein
LVYNRGDDSPVAQRGGPSAFYLQGNSASEEIANTDTVGWLLKMMPTSKYIAKMI